ncbi:hypothetical protein ACJQWK_06759 [Exserohilum turcicum]
MNTPSFSNRQHNPDQHSQHTHDKNHIHDTFIRPTQSQSQHTILRCTNPLTNTRSQDNLQAGSKQKPRSRRRKKQKNNNNNSITWLCGGKKQKKDRWVNDVAPNHPCTHTCYPTHQLLTYPSFIRHSTQHSTYNGCSSSGVYHTCIHTPMPHLQPTPTCICPEIIGANAVKKSKEKEIQPTVPSYPVVECM